MSGEHVAVLIYRANSKEELARKLMDQVNQLLVWHGPIMRAACRGDTFGTTLYVNRPHTDSRTMTSALSEAKLKIGQIGKMP